MGKFGMIAITRLLIICWLLKGGWLVVGSRESGLFSDEHNHVHEKVKEKDTDKEKEKSRMVEQSPLGGVKDVGWNTLSWKNVCRRIRVSQVGVADFATIQAAVDSVDVSNACWVLIDIAAGIYREKVEIPSFKPYIIFQGEGRTSTVITWGGNALVEGTANSATFSTFSHSFVARGIGFKNTSPRPVPGQYGGQAVAALLAGDMMAFYMCGFYGEQDTLFDYEGRHYFKTCYIEGSIDFIFGHAQSVFRNCHLHVDAAEAAYLTGSITAHNRQTSTEPSGFVFIYCNITGTGRVFLGRAWGPYSRVFFMFTYMSNIIVPEGWSDWNDPLRQRTVSYGQYKCFGPGSNEAGRVPWSHELTDEQAMPFLSFSYIDGGNWIQEF